jgi:hypothetical protein
MACIYFEHLFAHHQEVLYVQQLVYFLRIMSAGWLPSDIIPLDDEQIGGGNIIIN